jgi:hypothetical protein
MSLLKSLTGLACGPKPWATSGVEWGGKQIDESTFEVENGIYIFNDAEPEAERNNVEESTESPSTCGDLGLRPQHLWVAADEICILTFVAASEGAIGSGSTTSLTNIENPWEGRLPRRMGIDIYLKLRPPNEHIETGFSWDHPPSRLGRLSNTPAAFSYSVKISLKDLTMMWIDEPIEGHAEIQTRRRIVAVTLKGGS